MSDQNREQKTGASGNEEGIRQAKAHIVNRTMVYLTSMFIIITLVSAFFMAPEFYAAREHRQRMVLLEKNIEDLEKQIAILSAEPEKKPSVSAKLSHGLERVEDFGHGVADLGKRLQALEQKLGNTSENLQVLVSQIDTLQKTLQGQESLVAALEEIKKALITQQQPVVKTEKIPPAPAEKTELNPDILEEISAKDLKAAAMLLALGQFRKSADRNTPLESDLQILRELSADDPELLAAIDRLAPYANSGILSKKQLEKEFKGLASDIVISELRGEEANWTDKAKERLANLVKIRREGYVEGQETEAVVARAEYLLENDDIDGAISELQSLQGEAAKTADPWLAKAEAQASMDALINIATEKTLHQLSGSSNASLRKIMKLIDTMQQQVGGQSPLVPTPDMIFDMSPKEIPTLNPVKK